MWVAEDPARFLRERAEIKHLACEGWLEIVRWRVKPQIAVDFDLLGPEDRYELTLSYPELFPETPAVIRPRDKSLRLSEHQYGAGGPLCLEFRPDNWQTNITGADLIRSARKLLIAGRVDNQRGVLDAHQQTLGQRLRTKSDRFIVTQQLLELCKRRPISNGMAVTVRIIIHGSECVAFVSKVCSEGGERQPLHGMPSNDDAMGPLFTVEEQGQVFQVDGATFGAHVTSFESLAAMIGRPASVESIFSSTGNSRPPQSPFILVGCNNPQQLRVFRLVPGQEVFVVELATILPENHSERLPTEHRRLGSHRVAIVGMGSIGSKVAVSLARSGVRKFLLVDDDVMLPGNLRRHELSWMSVGIHKAKAVTESLAIVAPDCEVVSALHRLGGQESSSRAASILAHIGECDLIIDATADPEVFLLLAAVARRKRRPMCWGELFAGGIGGIIARARPEAEPHPLAVRTAVNAFLSEQPPAPYQNAVNYDTDEVRPLIAYDSDVAQISALLTRMSLDTLLNSKDGNFPHPAYLIGLKRAWIFQQPFEVYPVTAAGDGWDAVSETFSEADASAALQALIEIAAEGN